MRRRSARPRFVVAALAVLIGGFLTAELVARYALELGDPVLMQAHPTIEYLAKPDQDVRIYGKRHRINALGMRSDDPPPPDVEAIRVLVLGDSVINGGRQTDHEQLATTLAQRALHEKLGREVWIGNASAGSWGPANWRAYVETFGTLDANLAVVVVSPHDVWDVPTFDPQFAAQLQTRRPRSAAWVAAREIWARFGFADADAEIDNPNDLQRPPPAVVSPDAESRRAAEQSFADLLARFADEGVPAVVIYFPEADTDERHDQVRQRLRDIATHGNARFVDLCDHVLTDEPLSNPAYRDRMHPSDEGQRRLASVIVAVANDILSPDHSEPAVGSATATDL